MALLLYISSARHEKCIQQPSRHFAIQSVAIRCQPAATFQIQSYLLAELFNARVVSDIRIFIYLLPSIYTIFIVIP